jgi:hypothetical protein
MKDLFVLVADADAEATFKTLLSHHHKLQIRPITFTVFRYEGRDAGCRVNAATIMRQYRDTHHHALVTFDHEGSGKEDTPAEEIAQAIQHDLHRNGWQEGQTAVLLFQPELEIWLWTDSPNLLEAIGWRDNYAELQDAISSKGYWKPDEVKPHRPKEALLTILRQTRVPFSAAIFSKVAGTVSFKRCTDPTFQTFLKILQGWFPVE